MKRRDFLASSLAASALAGPSGASTSGRSGIDSDRPAPEYYELVLIHLRRGPQVKLVEDFFRDAAVPALNRAGIRPVGVFNTTVGPDSPTLYVLLPHPSLESLATTAARLAGDREYLKAGAPFSDVPATNPAYVRVENSLMVAFESIPRLEVPPAAAAHEPRIFELRIYESHSRKANKKKIEMFNQGEIAIFRRTGLRPVFFGETLIGTRLPNLTYMLTFANLEERNKNWAMFIADPEWKKLSATPGYTDVEIVSNISNLFLMPTAFSQI